MKTHSNGERRLENNRLRSVHNVLSPMAENAKESALIAIAVSIRLGYSIVMIKCFSTNRILTVVAGSLLAMTPLKSHAIDVANFDFSSPMLPTGAFTPYANTPDVSNIPNWTAAGEWDGVENAKGTTYASVPVGNNIAYDDGGTIGQTLTGNVLETGTYTLSVYDAARPSGGNAFSGGSLELLAGADVVDSVALTTPADGTFALTSLMIPVLASNTDRGQTLSIDLVGNGGGYGAGQSVDFNDVELSFIAAPEPSTWAMMLGGAAGLLFVAHRVRRDREA
jgi:hypothetical protein